MPCTTTPSLSPELAAKAEKELHEKEEWRERDIEALRSMVLTPIQKNLSTAEKSAEEISDVSKSNISIIIWYTWLQDTVVSSSKYITLYSCVEEGMCTTPISLVPAENTQLVAQLEDWFLVRFLRARKFDYERAYRLVLNYYGLRVRYHEIFTDFVPSAIGHVLEANMQGFLPHPDHNGCALFVLRAGKWDPSAVKADDVFRTNLMCLEKQIAEVGTQICGIVGLLDLKDLGFHHVRHFTTHNAARAVSLIQDSFPARFKAIHIINEPKVFDLIFTLARPFLSDKLKSRSMKYLQYHINKSLWLPPFDWSGRMCNKRVIGFQLYFHGTNLSSLHQHVPPELLPEEFGGTLGPFDNREWAKVLLDSEDLFIRLNQYGFQASQ
ncbi:TTPAL [Cordylochernes scorpioides]|uniref:TTPAL n=1 Tax=Cordylochernes scorpioides TaxID=51811 RepID=A0ABY6LDH8_9ARAC|nr:TTPAL [Cordylochernes scorpioides]